MFRLYRYLSFGHPNLSAPETFSGHVFAFYTLSVRYLADNWI